MSDFNKQKYWNDIVTALNALGELSSCGIFLVVCAISIEEHIHKLENLKKSMEAAYVPTSRNRTAFSTLIDPDLYDAWTHTSRKINLEDSIIKTLILPDSSIFIARHPSFQAANFSDYAIQESVNSFLMSFTQANNLHSFVESQLDFTNRSLMKAGGAPSKFHKMNLSRLFDPWLARCAPTAWTQDQGIIMEWVISEIDKMKTATDRPQPFTVLHNLSVSNNLNELMSKLEVPENVQTCMRINSSIPAFGIQPRWFSLRDRIKHRTSNGIGTMARIPELIISPAEDASGSLGSGLVRPKGTKTGSYGGSGNSRRSPK